jgi:cytochrome c oxidase subunit 2
MSVDAEMTPGPALTSEAETVERVWNAFVLSAAVIAVIVVVLILYCVIRFRRRDDRLPAQIRQNIPIEIVYTAVPLAIVIVLFVITFVTTRTVNHVDAAEPDLVVDVTGFQWNWTFDYPDLDVTVTGIEHERPELVLPSDARVRFRVTSIDVIHSFWIPGFRYKRDLIPGDVTEFDVDVLDKTGSFTNSGACAEFCGLDHAYMRFDVRVLAAADFEAWAAEAGGAS